jgi:hypothetical protein
MLSPERLEELLRETFRPRADDERCMLSCVGASERSDGGLDATLQLVHYYYDEQGKFEIVQVLEQPVLFVPFGAREEEERVAAFVRALERVLAQAMVGLTPGALLPRDLVPADALMLARAETEEDFVRALSVKSRLGKFLAGLSLQGSAR